LLSSRDAADAHFPPISTPTNNANLRAMLTIKDGFTQVFLNTV